MKPPSHISKAAQAYYRDAQPILADIDVNDPKQAQSLRDVVHPEWANTKELIKHDFQLKADHMGGVPGYWIETSHTQPEASMLLHFHGGAYVLGTAYDNAALAIHLAHSTGLPTFTVDYSLAPEHPFPAAVTEAKKCFLGLLEQGKHPDRIAVCGESAGAGLTLALCLALQEDREPLPAALGLISPWVDLTGRGDSVTILAPHDPDFSDPSLLYACGKAYAGREALDHPWISPMFASLRNMPPMLIQVGAREIMLSEALQLARRAKDADCSVQLDVWDGMWHAFNTFIDLPEAQRANADLVQYLVAGVSA